MEQKNKQTYKTLQDLAKILSLFNTCETGERSISDISKSVGMLPSKVSRMIRTLEKDGFFRKNSQTGKYSIGIEFFRLGIVYAHYSPLRKIVRPHLEQMARDVNLTAACGVLKDNSVIIIDRVENLNIDLMAVRLVLNLPTHATSIGRTLLAYLPRVEQDKVLRTVELKKLTPKTAVNLRVIKEKLRAIKKNGYAIDLGETDEDLYSIAAPIKNGDGQIVAAINLTGDKSQIPKEKLLSLVPYLKEKAVFISRQFDYVDDL
jgi:DNA-binding IclR family transcriptional regulator